MQENIESTKPKGKPVKASKTRCPTMHDSLPINSQPGSTRGSSTSQLVLEIPCGFSSNVFVVSMLQAVQPVDASTGTRSHQRDIIRSNAPIQTGPLLAKKNHPRPKGFPSTEIHSGPEMCSSGP
ncbi:hypothetical protein DPEC_G00044830 [Dallia pectoralis]|uniref:Uncharacterized protein n=1 Tax=Dallia pectoralis TaxID=75939 RepID=A0ACC2H9F2_DALPE|nr:hypothetical protein DPEC_G00044830 [Dallia pectoralis]